jgi:hypothetical protein
VENVTCPKCGHQATEDAICSNCGHATMNGDLRHLKNPVQKPPPPPEVANWVVEKMSPELIEEAIRTFNREEFLAGEPEIEKQGD